MDSGCIGSWYLPFNQPYLIRENNKDKKRKEKGLGCVHMIGRTNVDP